MTSRALMFARMLAMATIALPAALAAQPACPRAKLPAYAHNDYANAHPLTDALALGYRGVEADVFLVDGALRLGHDRRRARAHDTFEARYLAPLRALLARCDSLTGDGTRFLMAVELKEASRATYDSLVAALTRYPSVAAAVDVVLVGWSPDPATLDSAPVPLHRQFRIRRAGAIPDAAASRGVRVLSLDYGKTIGRWWTSAGARRRWLDGLAAIKAAYPMHRLRVHNAPVDAEVYRRLLAAGVDLVGTKDLRGTARVLESIAPPR